ncbi:MAG TPA: c-type cytochrome [Rhodanobacteraceae bacterium]|nr:c-type cytochrome [Rhodanobacteraceae bacterium]
MRKSRTTLLWLALLPAGAAGATSVAPPAALGRCAVCHGEDGHARIPGAPNLAGQPEQYLLQALGAYRTGQRKVPVMQAAVAPLSAADVRALAHWYAAQPACPPAVQAGHP